MIDTLLCAYDELFIMHGLNKPANSSGIGEVIKTSIGEFTKKYDNIAIYCNGEHTQMLLADYVFELKKAKTIIDNHADIKSDEGYKIIRDSQIEDEGIEAVVISTYKYRGEIAKSLRENHPKVDYLDIYEKIEAAGIKLLSEYYHSAHPYNIYKQINEIQLELWKNPTEELLDAVIEKYLQIKDFGSALKSCELIKNEKYNKLKNDIQKVYEIFLNAIGTIDENNVLMLCLDGFRGKDFKSKLIKLNHTLKDRLFYYKNAYSYSNSTYESLIPVFSEDYDLNGEFAGKESVPVKYVRMAKEAIEQGRKIYCYMDGMKLMEGKEINNCPSYQTATEKMWNFVIDASREKNGLYYVHILYETHFTFSNPYTKSKLISEGTAMLFDYLPMKGGKLRGDYEYQHECSMEYVDDILAPIFERLKSRTVLFADHGNLVLSKDTGFEEVSGDYLVFHDDWVRIPLAIISPENAKGEDEDLISLAELNDIVISLMGHVKYENPKRDEIKLARTAIYNPDFKKLFKMKGREKDMAALEMYINKNGKRKIVYR